MTDDRLERALSDAIADLAGTSAPAYLDDILERTSRTRQRPWWTFPRRYFSMTSALKFATAAGVAFALGIALAPAIVPTSQQAGVVPGAAASAAPETSQDTLTRAVPFTGQWEAMNQLPSDVEKEPGYPYRESNRLWDFDVVEVSDPRLDGDVVVSNNMHSYLDVAVDVYHAAFRIDNDEGAWVERPGLAMNFPGDQPTARTTIMDGQGAYDGLMAIMEIDWQSSASGLFDIRGIIVDGDVPLTPPPPPVSGAVAAASSDTGS